MMTLPSLPPTSSPAWQWIRGQLRTATRVTTGSIITPSMEYAPNWTGPVSGTFQLRGAPGRPVVAQEPSDHPHGDIHLEVRAVVVTDTSYVIGTTPVGPDHTFSFPSSRPGIKVFHLVDTATGSVMAEHARTTGLVRSYDPAPGSPTDGRTFTYDQALALITAESIGDDTMVATLTAGLMRLQTLGGIQDGGFVTSAAALNPEAAQPQYRTGNHSIATYALLRRLRSMSPTDADRPSVVSAATRAVDWLLSQQKASGVMEGLVTGGCGGSRADGSFDPSAQINWASTEHNLDAWHTLRLAMSFLGNKAAGRAAARLEDAMLARLWDPVTHRFHRGMQPNGPDPTPALDLDSWGSIFLHKVGRSDLATAALVHAQVFATHDGPVAGYAPELPTTSPTVWFEGSAGVSLAQQRMGDASAAALTLEALRAGQLPSGAWPQATRADPGMDMTADAAVAATAWMVLSRQAVAGHRSIWDD